MKNGQAQEIETSGGGGYEGEHDDLEELGWSVEAWKAHGGYANRNVENQNKHRERIWFSPECLSGSGGQMEMFI